eukprot:6214845-Pleurochrysis_carterae.AAC.2
MKVVFAGMVSGKSSESLRMLMHDSTFTFITKRAVRSFCKYGIVCEIRNTSSLSRTWDQFLTSFSSLVLMCTSSNPSDMDEGVFRAISLACSRMLRRPSMMGAWSTCCKKPSRDSRHAELSRCTLPIRVPVPSMMVYGHT